MQWLLDIIIFVVMLFNSELVNYLNYQRLVILGEVYWIGKHYLEIFILLECNFEIACLMLFKQFH
jgi:hypothetical protein